MIVASAFWGASFIFTKGLFLSEPHITPTIILTGRMFIATIFTVPLLLLTGKWEPIRPGDLKFFLILAMLEPFFYSLCETGGIRFVSGTLASIIIATIPLFIPFGMAIAYKERPNGATILGVALSLVGIAIMSMGEDATLSASPLGLFLLALAVVIAVLYTLMLVKILGRYRPTTITTYQNLIALIYFLPLMLIKDHSQLPLLSFSPRMWFYLAFLGLFCSTCAYMMFNYGLHKLGATTGSVYNNIIPIFSLLLALLMGQEAITWTKVIGIVVVLVGLTLSQRKPTAQSDPTDAQPAEAKKSDTSTQ